MSMTLIAIPIKTSLTLESSPCYAFTYFPNNIAIILYCTHPNLSIKPFDNSIAIECKQQAHPLYVVNNAVRPKLNLLSHLSYTINV